MHGTHARTHVQMDGQFENIMPTAAHRMSGRDITSQRIK